MLDSEQESIIENIFYVESFLSKKVLHDANSMDHRYHRIITVNIIKNNKTNNITNNNIN